eukprot:TRINITY_DN54851_c0_g1_i1.p1 TRINITY_DN54851_c0_g1~~TRINITY_DN54851_c0_g1_i1.p1  ORF type:complete len:106 (+),score=24.20 TRINITY_DN54851_c0_g1_i1:172-489(+)
MCIRDRSTMHDILERSKRDEQILSNTIYEMGSMIYSILQSKTSKPSTAALHLLNKTDDEAAVSFLQQQIKPVSYTHLRAHETSLHLVCRLLLEKKKNNQFKRNPQ